MMKFFRNLFGASRKVEAAPKSKGFETDYSDLLANPAENGKPGTAEPVVDLREATKRSAAEAAKRQASAAKSAGPSKAGAPGEKSTMDMIRDINAELETKASTPEPKASSTPGIWDLDDDVPASSELPAPGADASAAATPARRRRTKTRLIGFDKSDGSSVDALAPAIPEPDAAEPAERVTFPVGWILVVNGPGRGESFPLINGLSTIGRGADQIVRLDFGDAAVSRSSHAAIAFEQKKKTFVLGHGNKANIVRLNDTPVISNEEVKNGDLIRVGETTLRLVTLVSKDFDWADFDTEEGDDDVAIA